MRQPDRGTSTSFPYRLGTVSWKLVLFVGLFIALYLPFVLPFLLYPQTEYVVLSTASARVTIELIAATCVILAAMAMTRYVDRMPLRTLGLAWRRCAGFVCGGTVLGGGLLLAALLILIVSGCVEIGPGIGPFTHEFVWTLAAMLLNTIGQEVLVHGYVQQVVRREFGTAAGVIVAAFVLVLLHYTLFHTDALLLLVNLFIAGLILGMAFLWSRSLWLPIGIHFGWNYVQGPVLGLPVTTIDLWPSDLVVLNGNPLLTGGTMGIEGGLVASIVLIAATAAFYYILRRNRATQLELEVVIQ